MRAVLPAPFAGLPASAGVFRQNPGPAQRLLAPLVNLAESSDWLVAGSVGEFAAAKKRFHIPRFVFMGPKGGGDTVRLAIFAAIRGDEPSGAEAIVSFLQQLESHPALAAGYHIYTYPICNPSGFAAGSRRNAAGHDLTAHFWNGSDQPEAYYLEREIGVHHFHGVISLGSTHHPNPRFFFSGGQNSTLRSSLASSSIPATQIFLAEEQPENTGGTALLAQTPESSATGFLTETDELRPTPFEINFQIPRRAPRQTQIDGAANALKSILDSYRTVLAIRQNI